LLLPSTKFANVNSGFSRPPHCGSGSIAARRAAPGASTATDGDPTGAREASGRAGSATPSMTGAGVGGAGRRDPISTTISGDGAGTSSSTSSPMRAAQFWLTQSTT
jgi:hypothetical protein